jgi:hypothetical protein
MSKMKWTARSLVAAVAAIAMLGLATSAQAVTISVSKTTNIATSETLTVKLAFSAGEAFYAVAQCNDDLADGRACNGTTAIGLIAVGSYPAAGEKLGVNKTFTNASLIPGMPPLGTTTTCKGVSTDSNCAVFVSTYDSGGKPVGGTQKTITFK